MRKEENYFEQDMKRRQANPDMKYPIHAIYVFSGQKKALCNGATIKKYIDTWYYGETTCAGCLEKMKGEN